MDNESSVIDEIVKDIKERIKSCELSFAYKQGLQQALDIINYHSSSTLK